MTHDRVYDIMQNVVDNEERRRRSTTSNHAPSQFDEGREKPGERDSHKAVPITVTPHRLIAAEVPLELSPTNQESVNILQYVHRETGAIRAANISQYVRGQRDVISA